jgi:dephospho-CoA kinase
VLLVGLTGGIGAGKSVVARLLEERGAVLIDADVIAREVVEPGKPAWSKVIEHFGRDVLIKGSRINRQKLADIVFADRKRLALLNAITHPEIMRVVAERLETLRLAETADMIESQIVVIDAPLLVEAGGASSVDYIVVVTASDEARVRRLVQQRTMSEKDARARIKAQGSTEEKIRMADWLITNEGTLADLEAQVGALWERLRDRTATHADD